MMLAPSTSSIDGESEQTDERQSDHEFHLRQLELMHQYTAHTYHTLAINPQPPETQLNLPVLAFEHEFLLDTIFATASLHIAFLRPEEAQSRVADAVRYHSRALVSTRQRLAQLNASECRAMFHCSAQLGLIILAFRAVDVDNAQKPPPTDTLMQLGQLWRGTHLILMASKDLIDPEMYQVFFPQPGWGLPDQSLDSELSSILESLRQKARNDSKAEDVMDVIVPMDLKVSTEGEPRTACLEAIGKLQILFSICEPEPSRILAWIVETPPVFWELVSGQDRLACAIVLLWSVTLGQFQDRWWALGFRRQIIDELIPIVGDSDLELAEVVRWVRREEHHVADDDHHSFGPDFKFENVAS